MTRTTRIISLDLETAEDIVKLLADLARPDNGDDEFRAESDHADEQMLLCICDSAIVSGKKDDEGHKQVIALAKKMMNIIA